MFKVEIDMAVIAGLTDYKSQVSRHQQTLFIGKENMKRRDNAADKSWERYATHLTVSLLREGTHMDTAEDAPWIQSKHLSRR